MDDRMARDPSSASDHDLDETDPGGEPAATRVTSETVSDEASLAEDDEDILGGIGAVTGGVAGAAIGGAVAGPPGAVVGGAVGAVGGAVVGEAIEDSDDDEGIFGSAGATGGSGGGTRVDPPPDRS
jgi:hypothetical protein